MEATSPTAAADVRTRDVVGVPVSVIDYDGALGVMDRMVDTRERG
jgi:hypothetical protein